MIMDALQTFSTGVAVTASAVVGDYQTRVGASTNTLANEFGTCGEPLYLAVIVTEAFATATSVNFALVSDSSTGLASSPTTHAQTGAIAIASLTVGATFYIPISYSQTCETYYGVYATVAGSSATAGKVTTFITNNFPSYKAYAVPHANKTGR
jgi:hypothetical protein